jgi:hypothetical protein
MCLEGRLVRGYTDRREHLPKSIAEGVEKEQHGNAGKVALKRVQRSDRSDATRSDISKSVTPTQYSSNLEPEPGKPIERCQLS